MSPTTSVASDGLWPWSFGVIKVYFHVPSSGFETLDFVKKLENLILDTALKVKTDFTRVMHAGLKMQTGYYQFC